MIAAKSSPVRMVLKAIAALVFLGWQSACITPQPSTHGAPSRWTEGKASDLFRSFPRAAEVVNAEPETFRRELFGAEPDAPGNVRVAVLRDFVNLLADPEASRLDAASQDALLAGILALLARQTATNPEKYVSHGSDHSIRTMDFAQRVLAAVPAVRHGMVARYGLSEKQARLILMLEALLHDVGYADLAEHKVKKWLHGLASGPMVESLLATEELGSRLLPSPELRADFLRAITLHGQDEGACMWLGNPLYESQCRFVISRQEDPSNPVSKTTPLLHREPYAYTREYVEADASKDPLLFVIRLADNLDASNDRLTSLQDNEEFMRFLLRLFQDAEVRGPPRDLSAARSRALQVAPSLATTHRVLVENTNGESILHFYSNWILRGLELSGSDGMLTVTVQVRPSVPEDLSFEKHSGLGLYQVNRLASALAALWLGPETSMLDAVKVKLEQPVPGLARVGPIPLRAFTKRPDYTPAGPAADPLCVPECGWTQFLTQSLEPCLEVPEQPEGCDLEAFSRKPPFSDLHFGIFIGPGP